MKKTMNRLLCGLLCLAMVLCLVPIMKVPVRAETGYDRGYTGSMPGDGKIYAHGLDVSAWQESGLNFQNFANAGYDYVILRCGTSYGKDKCFEEYYASAKAAGLDVGCYFYSYALDKATAQQEAYSVLSWIEGKVFEYPVYFDFEDPTQIDLSYSLSAEICRGFMDVLRDHGYLVGIYSMSWILSRDWITTSGIRNTYEAWVAHVYSEAANTGITSGEYNIYKDRYCSLYGMHQYSFTTYVNGAGPFDANVCYKDYPTIVSTYGFNGYFPDNEEPIISDVVYSNVSASGYTISCRVTDDGIIKRVAFPTWTEANGQDDLPDYFMSTQTGTKNGDIYTFRVNASAHNNETGLYHTHIYAEDQAGNIVCLPLDPVEVRNDTVGPVITDVMYSNVSSAGYTITCTVTDDWGVNKVSFPTWTLYNGQDDLPDYFFETQLGTRCGDKFTFHVKASEHNNETGYYATHIYAFDCAGNRTFLPMPHVDVRDDDVYPVICDVTVSDVTVDGYTVTCKVTDDWGIARVAFPTWTEANGQDDMADDYMNTQLGTKDGDTYTFVVKASDHNKETGNYITHIYAEDCGGNVVSVAVDPVAVFDPATDRITLVADSPYAMEGEYLYHVPAGVTVDTLLGEFINETLQVVDCNRYVLSGSMLVGTGSVINLSYGDTVIDSVTVVVLADLDGNGVVDTTDYLRVKSATLGRLVLDNIQMIAADVDGNGTINVADYNKIKKYLLNEIQIYA